MGAADSAGVPWQGRHFEPNPASDDDGSAPPALVDAILRFRARELGESGVVAAVRGSRLLVPLLAEAGPEGEAGSAGNADPSQELSLVTIAAPDGRPVLPAFSSVEAMRSWNPVARPVPVAATRVALAAVEERTDLVILDPAAPTVFAIRRPALWAIARNQPWTPSYLDEEVLAAFMTTAEYESAVVAVQLAPGDPGASLVGPELVVHLSIRAGLDQDHLGDLLARLKDRWAGHDLIANRVDSMKIRLVAV